MKTVALAAIAAVGCVDNGPGPQPKKIEASFITANLVTVVPADVAHVDVSLGGKVTYVGTKVDRAILIPGQSTKITNYWRVDQPPGAGWRVFAQLRGAPGTADFMNLDATDMQIGHPVGTWHAGEIIADPQDVVLRPDWKSRTATFSVGLLRVGGHDVGDRMAASGEHVVDRAIVARTFDVDLSKAPPPAGTIYVAHAPGPITIDGTPGDPGWTGAVTSPEFATAEGSPDPVGKATAKLSWDEQYLYAFVQITDSDIFSQYKQHDDPLWKQDAVELFIDADGNRRGYVELQTNPNNATFDSWFVGTRSQPGDEKWDSGMITAVKVRGTADQSGDTDQGWDVEIAIPLAAVKAKDEAMNVQIPPHVGDRWHLNIVRVDTKTGGTNPSASSWNRITYQDFHALDRMLTVVFADSSGSIVAKPAEAAGSAAGSGFTGSGAAGSGALAVPVAPGVRTEVRKPPEPETVGGKPAPPPKPGVVPPNPGVVPPPKPATTPTPTGTTPTL